MISTDEQRLTYTSFNKADSIIQSNYVYTLQYGQQNQRTISKLFSSGSLQKTVYYVGAFERHITPGESYPKDIHYIYGGDGLAAIYTKQYSSENMYYVHKDHLGSFDKLTNSAGGVVQSTSFDECSAKHGFCEARAKADVERIPARKRSRERRRRNPDNWTYANIPATIFSRGYTGHCLSRSSGKHLDQFDLINMNGRIYDPLLGRFLSADKYVQNPFGSQGYNRYSYVSNNPLRFVDPSGWIKQNVEPAGYSSNDGWTALANRLMGYASGD